MKFRNNVATVLVRVWQDPEASIMKGLLTKMWAKLREPARNEEALEDVLAIPGPEGLGWGSGISLWLNPTRNHWARELVGAIYKSLHPRLDSRMQKSREDLVWSDKWRVPLTVIYTHTFKIMNRIPCTIRGNKRKQMHKVLYAWTCKNFAQLHQKPYWNHQLQPFLESPSLPRLQTQTDPGALDRHLSYREEPCCWFSEQDRAFSSINYMEVAFVGNSVHIKTILKILCVDVENRSRFYVEINNKHIFHQINVW